MRQSTRSSEEMRVRLLSLLITTMAIVRLSDGEPLVLGPVKYVPRIFQDEMLPEGQRKGELVQHLGRVQVLNTYLKPKSIEEFKTSFSIFTNWSASKRQIRVQPDSWSRLGVDKPQSEIYGPYLFDLDEILKSGYDASKRTVIMIPGYFSPEEASWVREARNSWLELDRDINVIAVDWSDTNKCTYSRAVAHTVIVARQVTILLHYLAELSGTNLQNEQFLNRLHLIGHSLGAHISGFVGQDLAGKVGRITGLDPAGPTFDQFSRDQRLDRSDARFVEVLHTNSGRWRYLNLLTTVPLQALNSISFSSDHSGRGDTFWFGIDKQIGHIDYYANNGRLQDGCNDVLHICDHARARDIYVDLLKYESSLRRSQSAVSLVSLLQEYNVLNQNKLSKMNRLYAFKAPDYETFASGGNFIMNCPELLTITKHLDDEEALKVFRKCAVPLLDVLRPIDELILELRDVYGINFDPDVEEGDRDNSISARNSAYYFKTSSVNGHLVGDHYLLKVYLMHEPSWDPDRCVFEVQIMLKDDEKMRLELTQIVDPTADQRILAIPFVHIDNSRIKDQYNNLMKLIKLVEIESEEFNISHHYKASREFVHIFQDLFPRTIMLSVAKSKSTGIFGSVKNMTIKMLKSSEEPPACSLTIDMVEVHPLTYGLKRNFGALYGRDIYISGLNKQLPVLSAKDQLSRLEKPDRFITNLSTDSIKSFSVGLEAAVVG